MLARTIGFAANVHGLITGSIAPTRLAIAGRSARVFRRNASNPTGAMVEEKGRMIISGPKNNSTSPEAKDAWTGRPTVRFVLPRKKSDPIRKELVAKIKKDIANGTYDTPERFDAAFERMLQRLGLD